MNFAETELYPQEEANDKVTVLDFHEIWLRLAEYIWTVFVII